VRIHRAEVAAMQQQAPAGELLAASAAGIDIACGHGALRLLEVQRDGGRAQSVRDYLNARPALRR
jgi:methionyl-tRNA formyltransferase